MTLTLSPIYIRLPSGLKDQYDTPKNQGLFETDLTSDRLIMRIIPNDYNAANPTNINTDLGHGRPFDDTRYSLYSFEAVDRDKRSEVSRYVLRDLLNHGGNLSLYGVNIPSQSGSEPLIAVEDFLEHNESGDHDHGYSLRIGTMQVEALRGNFSDKSNVAVGHSYVITPNANLTSGATLDATEWANYKVVEQYNTRKYVAGVWSPNTPYLKDQRLAAIAPEGVCVSKTFAGGCRIIFTQKYRLESGNLITYVPHF